ncbi:MAG: rhodanese-like domain-containing protein [Marinicaulis sp.]|nr:rhodanese-like domain-containing protein [Marinicaulis sp.]
MDIEIADQAKSRVIDLDPEKVSTLLTKNACLLIDVRETGEFEAERIPGAMLLPLSEFDPKSVPFEGRRRIISHCGTGKRSHNAASRSLSTANDDVSHLTGGLRAWKEAGLETISFDPETGKWRQAPYR